MTEDTQWGLWLDEAHTAAENMAIDDVLMDTMRHAESTTILRIYSWSEPAYSIGYFQPYNSAPQGSHTIIRRPSGGGVVDHSNDLTFTLVFPKHAVLFQCDRFESYRLINAAVQDAFASLGVDCWLYDDDIPDDHDRSYLVCFQQPARFDVVNAHGKLCGGAQRRKLFGMLHQGSILLDQLGDMSQQAIIDQLIQAFGKAFGITFFDYILPDALYSEARELARARYANDAWNQKK